MMRPVLRQPSVLPGFGPALGVTLLALSSIVLVPLAALVAAAAGQSWDQFLAATTAPRVLAAYRLTFGAAAAAAVVNGVLGTVVAWVLVRYRFPGHRLVDSLIDLPFAMPTAISGIALTAVCAPTGWVGRLLGQLGVQVAFTPLGVVVALVFIGLPFVVRTLQPALTDLPHEAEEAAACLGAGRRQTFRRVILPAVRPALLTGVALAFARGLGEYGSVVFISGNLPGRTEIAPLLIVARLEQYDMAGATAIAVVLLVASFLMLLVINLLQRATRRHGGREV